MRMRKMLVWTVATFSALTWIGYLMIGQLIKAVDATDIDWEIATIDDWYYADWDQWDDEA